MCIKDLGFKNIQVLDFNVQYNLKDTNLNISILKSGDLTIFFPIYLPLRIEKVREALIPKS